MLKRLMLISFSAVAGFLLGAALVPGAQTREAAFSLDGTLTSTLAAIAERFLGISQAHAEDALQTLEATQVQWIRDPEIVPYKAAYKFFADYAECPMMQPRFNVEPSDKYDIKALHIELVGDKTNLDVTVNPDQRTLDVPNSKEALDDKAEFLVNQKRGMVKVNVDAVMKLPTSLNLHYRDILDAVAQANRCEKKVAPFYVRVARSDYIGVRLRFGKEGVGATVKLDDGTKAWTTNENGDIFIALETSLMASNPALSLSTMPKAVWPSYTKPSEQTLAKN